MASKLQTNNLSKMQAKISKKKHLQSISKPSQMKAAWNSKAFSQGLTPSKTDFLQQLRKKYLLTSNLLSFSESPWFWRMTRQIRVLVASTRTSSEMKCPRNNLYRLPCNHYERSLNWMSWMSWMTKLTRLTIKLTFRWTKSWRSSASVS